MQGCMYRGFTAVREHTEKWPMLTWSWQDESYRCRRAETFFTWVDMVKDGRIATEIKETRIKEESCSDKDTRRGRA